MQEKWILINKKADFAGISEALSVDLLTARILANRGIDSIEKARMLREGGLDQLPDPALLKDAGKAAGLLQDALARGEKIAIASDYDADGLFAGQILKESLEALGAAVRVYAPDRMTEGYGVNDRIVDEALADGASVLVTCDNGIAAFSAVSYARSRGMRVIVTDHHETQDDPAMPGEKKLPEADAVIDPKQETCDYPFDGICGSVVALKLMQLLYRTLGKDEDALLRKMLPYAAIATVADVMDLTEENRVIVREGLSALSETESPGLRALLKARDLEGKELTPYHVGFVIGPCLNAAGRLKHVELAQQLLTAKSEEEAAPLAEELVRLNRERQQLTEQGTREAQKLLEEKEPDRVLVLHLPQVHESVVGIVAGRLKELYQRPVIVLSGEEEILKGSARSIPGFPLPEKLSACADLLERFGGHAMAAGLSIRRENLDAFRERINEISGLTEEDLRPLVRLDAAMPPEYATAERIQEWDSLGPYGKGFERPLFGRSGLTVTGIKVLGLKKNAVRIRFLGESGTPFEGIWFGDSKVWEDFIREHYGEKAFTMLERGQMRISLALAYQPVIHEYAGMRTIQFQVRHFQPV